MVKLKPYFIEFELLLWVFRIEMSKMKPKMRKFEN